MTYWPLIKRFAPVIGVALLLLAFFVWLHFHDRGVIKRDNDALNAAAAQVANEARADANEKQELRNEAFEKSQRELANASDPSEYLRMLKAQQDRRNSQAAR